MKIFRTIAAEEDDILYGPAKKAILNENILFYIYVKYCGQGNPIQPQ